MAKLRFCCATCFLDARLTKSEADTAGWSVRKGHLNGPAYTFFLCPACTSLLLTKPEAFMQCQSCGYLGRLDCLNKDQNKHMWQHLDGGRGLPSGWACYDCLEYMREQVARRLTGQYVYIED